MKTTTSTFVLAGLLISGSSFGRCHQSDTLNATTQSQPKRTKKVEVFIKDVKPIFSANASTSFAVGPKSKADVTVYWNGYGFICKKDSGETFWRYSNDLAFQKRQTARFIVRKKVTITDKNGSVTVSTSDTVTVKRGVPRTI